MTFPSSAAENFKAAWTKAPPKHAGKTKPKKESSIQGQRARPDTGTQKEIAENTTKKFMDDIDHIRPMKDKN